MKRMLLIAVGVALSASAQEMPTLPKGARPKNWKEVKAILKPLGWEVTRPEVATEGIRIVENLTYATRPERKLKLDLYLPKAENAPLVVIIHGGGWKKGSKESQRPQGIWFANHGYAVAAMQYRLSGEARFPAAINDCNAAIDWLRAKSEQYGYNPGKIAVWGGSAGAHLAALVGMTNPAVKAAMVVAGPTDGTSEKVQGISADPASNWHMFMGGSYAEKAELYKQASPFLHVKKSSPPVLLIAEHSLESSRPMLDALKARDVMYETMILSGGIHGHWNWEPWFEPVMKRCDGFLKKAFGK